MMSMCTVCGEKSPELYPSGGELLCPGHWDLAMDLLAATIRLARADGYVQFGEPVLEVTPA
jgi:hypothetical protein